MELDKDTVDAVDVLEGLDSGELKLWSRSASNKAEKTMKLMQGRDPEKLDALLEAVWRVASNALDCGRHSEVSTDAMDAMINALTAFEGGSHE